LIEALLRHGEDSINGNIFQEKHLLS
jgi:hypothetical protein